MFGDVRCVWMSGRIYRNGHWWLSYAVGVAVQAKSNRPGLSSNPRPHEQTLPMCYPAVWLLTTTSKSYAVYSCQEVNIRTLKHLRIIAYLQEELFTCTTHVRVHFMTQKSPSWYRILILFTRENPVDVLSFNCRKYE